MIYINYLPFQKIIIIVLFFIKAKEKVGSSLINHKMLTAVFFKDGKIMPPEDKRHSFMY